MDGFIEMGDLIFKADQLANMALALNIAMFESGECAENFEGAMYLFENLIRQYSKDLKATFREIYPKKEAVQ
ncbi:MAG: hypothetical protein ACOX0K_07140 [Oscillospiraceae bacterium]|jgi:hypothetical protein